MQTRSRQEFDSDLIENYASVTEMMTDQNQHAINCVDCGKVFYADQPTFESVGRSIRRGLDNPFLCEYCQKEYDDLAHPEH